MTMTRKMCSFLKQTRLSLQHRGIKQAMPVENEPTQIKSGMCSSKGHVTLLEETGLTRSGRLVGYLRAGLQISPDRRHR
jgi:hypothetical protein